MARADALRRLLRPVGVAGGARVLGVAVARNGGIDLAVAALPAGGSDGENRRVEVRALQGGGRGAGVTAGEAEAAAGGGMRQGGFVSAEELRAVAEAEKVFGSGRKRGGVALWPTAMHAVPCHAVPYTVPCCAALLDAVPCCAVLCCVAVPCGAMLCCAARCCSAMPCHAMPCRAVRRPAVPSSRLCCHLV
eukprot:354845-Chlamydomonas_euryale.AAC.2